MRNDNAPVFGPADELRAIFLAELGRGHAVALAAHERLRSAIDDAEALKALRGFFHRLSGDAGSVGYPLLGSLGAACERLTEAAPEALPKSLRTLGDALENLRTFLASELPRKPDGAAAQRPVDLLWNRTGASKGRILMVEDDPFAARMMEGILSLAGYETIWRQDGAAAFAFFDTDIPDLVLIDVQLPGMDGFELCRRLRARSVLEIVPILFVSARSDVEQRIAGLSAGGNDYLVKPFDPRELVARVSTHLQRLESLRELAVRDGLTHCYNHKFFKARLGEELARAHRHKNPLSVALLDIDFFKQVNDTHGHLVGDRVLAQLASLVSTSVRSIDLVARYGGEEFALLLPETEAAEAAVLAARIRERVERHPFGGGAPEPAAAPAPLKVTVSIGVAQTVAPDAPDQFLARVDGALYSAKEHGRNRVVVASPVDGVP
ncbi:MAG: diguanylate cyclase [Deltaproteobacteria bacterium]